jgi:hypothetical protein
MPNLTRIGWVWYFLGTCVLCGCIVNVLEWLGTRESGASCIGLITWSLMLWAYVHQLKNKTQNH